MAGYWLWLMSERDEMQESIDRNVDRANYWQARAEELQRAVNHSSGQAGLFDFNECETEEVDSL
jgi:hypothetical protein